MSYLLVNGKFKSGDKIPAERFEIVAVNTVNHEIDWCDGNRDLIRLVKYHDGEQLVIGRQFEIDGDYHINVAVGFLADRFLNKMNKKMK